ncbi:MAG: glycoside hydrolase family 16 protein [Armatimonadota bacterium]|nr:glycoside hydrolase family 16 protein [Armatimonadota bacterium]
MALSSLALGGQAAQVEQTLHFSGYEWIVKEGFWGPGPNHWEPHNVFVDEQGRLHLKLTQHDGRWYASEVTLKQRLGFGCYQWQVAGRVDQFDPNVVLGLFNYTVPEVGPDGTNEIDIEFARWGKPENPAGNYSVWPAQKGAPHASHRFEVKLEGDYTMHRFDWTAQRVSFQSLHGHYDDPAKANENAVITNFVFEPKEPARSIPQHPLPVKMNLWLFRDRPPQNGQEVEIVIHSFRFTPAPEPTSPDSTPKENAP